MTVQQNRLDLRQQRIVAIDVRPARLHHADLRIGEVMDRAHEEIFRRREVSVKNSNEFASCRFQPFS